MANSLTSLSPYFWAKEAERSLFVDNKAMAIANTTLQTLVAGEGKLVYRQIISYPASATYTPGTDITTQAISSSSESLSVDTWKASLVTIDDTEKRQSIVDLGTNVSKKMMAMHNNTLEQAVTYEAVNAQWSLDDGNIGGTPGSNMSLNTSNIPQVFIAADTKLDAIDAPKAGRTAVIGGHFLGTLKLQQAGRNTVFGDGVNTRGVVTNLFGWDILYSNNLYYTASLALATNPTAADTITIAGVTFTFATSLTVAGNLIICDTPTNNINNVVAALNAPATAIAASSTAGYQVVSAEDAFLLRDKRRIAATAVGASGLTITGYGDIVVSETLTAAADVWSVQTQDSLFCVKGCVDLIVQIPPHVEVVRDPDQFSDIVNSLLGYGKKTFADGAREMVRVKIAANTSDWA